MGKNKKITQASYIFHFITRSFLISVLCILIFLGIIMALYLGDMMINNDTNKKPLFSTYVILTPSMVPTINVNDAILVKRLDNDNYKVGDVITFYSNDINYQGLAVTHRIIEKQKISDSESVYTTKGDNNRIIDPASVKTKSIYGKVLFKIPGIGYIKKYFTKPSHYLLLLIVPATIFILYNLLKIVVLMNKRRKKNI